MVCRFRYFPTYVQCEPYDVMSCHTCILLLPYLTCLPYLELPTTLVGSMLLHGLFCSFLLLSVEVSAQVSSFSSFELYVLLQPPIGDLTILIPCLLDPPFLAQFISCPLLLFGGSFHFAWFRPLGSACSLGAISFWILLFLAAVSFCAMLVLDPLCRYILLIFYIITILTCLFDFLFC